MIIVLTPQEFIRKHEALSRAFEILTIYYHETRMMIDLRFNYYGQVFKTVIKKSELKELLIKLNMITIQASDEAVIDPSTAMELFKTNLLDNVGEAVIAFE